jgi:THO complex subunit 1
MSEVDVAACRRLAENGILSIIDSRDDLEERPITEAECKVLLQQFRDVFAGSGVEPLQLIVDTTLRDLLYAWISELSITDPRFARVWYLLDIATFLGDCGYSEPASNFLLVENILDSQTVSGCRRVFDYLESRRDKLIATNFKAKNLVILRTCNELLRRLSRAEDTVFCGRVFIFLFQSFPLGDRSSVNLRGEFHVENATIFDPEPKKSKDAIKPMEIDNERPISSGGQTPASTVAEVDVQKTGRSTPMPVKIKQEGKTNDAPPDLDTLFPQFWSLQALFSNPKRLFDPSEMKQFKDSMLATLACFRSISGSSSASSTTQIAGRGAKRKRSGDGSRLAQTYNPKYLTNRDLFDLEVHDLAFRRHILTQCLIMLDFLLSLTPAAKAKWQGILKERNKSVLYEFTLSDEDTKHCQSMRQQIATYLQQQGPGNDGKMYYRMVDTVLSRDKNWAMWKTGSCPPIAKPPVAPGTYLSSQGTLSEHTKKQPFTNRAGAGEFDFLSQTTSLEALKHPTDRHHVPSAEQFYKAIETDKLDEEMAFDDTEKAVYEEKIQGKLWKALRASNLDGRRFALCDKIKDGANLKALIGQDEELPTETTETAAKDPDAAKAPFQNGESQADGESAPAPSVVPDATSPTDGSSDPIASAGTAPTSADQKPSLADAAAGEATEAQEDAAFAPAGGMDVDEGEPVGNAGDSGLEAVPEQPSEASREGDTDALGAEITKEE